MKYNFLHFILIIFICCPSIYGRDTLGPFMQTVERLESFGNRIPQEKVYVQLDNRCYFLGDTIWFKAYTQQTNNGKPSEMSGTLYVELYDQEGYLKERKLVEMKHGQGTGFFATDNVMYAGFYELRAYTRWQLNWGEFTHKHSKQAEKWFFNKAMSHEYFRDYEKLYSRTFPIYDGHQTPGDYYLDMTQRPNPRPSFANIEVDATPSIHFYPEGGNLVEGLPCRVAYEAVMSNGEYMDGVLLVGTDSIPVRNRGRGVFTLTPLSASLPRTVFVDAKGKQVKCTLPKVETEGVSLRVGMERDTLTIETRALKGEVLKGQLCLTLMHQGVLTHAWRMKKDRFQVALPTDSLPIGVNQITVSDVSGRVWADRLFFVKGKDMSVPTVTVSGNLQDLKPYQPVEISVRSPSKDTFLSLAVRDASREHGNFDNASILAELLLCSEIKGFVPHPDYFFEKDDTVHNTALELLMLTQGWRRFDWKEMAMRGEFEILHPVERTPVLTGVAHKYTALQKYDPVRYGIRYYEHALKFGVMDTIEFLMMESERTSERHSHLDHRGMRKRVHKLPSERDWIASIGAKDNLKSRLIRDGEKLKREVRVHAEFYIKGSDSIVVGDVVTNKMGRFRINMPRFQGKCQFHLAASDTTRWTREEKKDNYHLWILADETDYPEFYVRLSYPYPLFVKALNTYQTSLDKPDKVEEDTLFIPKNVKVLKEQFVTSRRNSGLIKRKYQEPMVKLDAYEAFNMASDAGLIDGWYTSTTNLAVGIARYLCSDMGINERYSVIDQVGDKLDLQDELFQIDGMNPIKAKEEYN